MIFSALFPFPIRFQWIRHPFSEMSALQIWLQTFLETWVMLVSQLFYAFFLILFFLSTEFNFQIKLVKTASIKDPRECRLNTDPAVTELLTSRAHPCHQSVMKWFIFTVLALQIRRFYLSRRFCFIGSVSNLEYLCYNTVTRMKKKSRTVK